MKDKLPFKIYTVYAGFGDPELQSVTVMRITATKWWFKRSGDLGFQCRTGCSPNAYALTPREAWSTFLVETIAQRTKEDQKITFAQKELAKL